VPWDADALFMYLRQGWHPDHGVARGPMAQVVSNLSQVSESDVRAIATYMADMFGAPTADRKRGADEVLAQANSAPAPPPSSGNATGASVYAAACAACHGSDRAPPYGGINLALSSAFSGPDARNAANIVLSGIRPVAGERSPIMPGFADSMSDDQIAALLDYLRARFGKQPPWTNTADIVRDARRTQTVFVQTSPAPGNAPADATQRGKP
jgi:mono/diheme cytochrome c family protein